MGSDRCIPPEVRVEKEVMNIRKPFATVSILVFALISCAHLLRVFIGAEVVVNGVYIPLWISVIAAAVSGGLAYLLWREIRAI